MIYVIWGLTAMLYISLAVIAIGAVVAVVRYVYWTEHVQRKQWREAMDARRKAREKRLRDSGYDEQSGEQRKDQLARNVASKDWPK